MEDYQSQGNHYQKTTSANSRGGCFSLLFSPIYYILLALAIFLMANGETTQPWDLTAARQISAGDESIVPQQKLAPLFTPEVLYWEGNILRWAADWDLDPNLVATVMQIESCGDFNAISSAGAIGLPPESVEHLQYYQTSVCFV